MTALLAQILTGHGGFAQYLYRLKLKNSPYCACAPDEVQNVLHVLKECLFFVKELVETETGTGVKIVRQGFPNLVNDDKNIAIFSKFCEGVTRRCNIKNSSTVYTAKD
ncbi:hypothetical protein EVAR_54745_1 [Eumeta japonica]|uniref:Uncharacterized protein n=1 Tax=Eumeta variegata TaxID=151549 RepID=A0A4C1Z170_EUMVA|nr:hypothetical protein EVAR_54745_1 [Eumeta japonica]